METEGPSYRPEGVPPSLQTAAAWSWRLLLVGLALLVVVEVAARLALAVWSLSAAVLLAAGLQPLSAVLVRRGLPRALAALLVLVGLLGALGAIGWLIGDAVTTELPDLRAALADGLDRVRDWVVNGPLPIGDRQFSDGTDEAIRWLQQTGGGSGGVVGAASAATRLLSGVLLTLFTLFFLLHDGRHIANGVLRTLPRQARTPARGAAERAWHALVGYARGIFVVALCDATLIALLLLLLGLPLVLPLAALTFVGAFVPVAGAAVAGTASVLIALVDAGPTKAALVLAGVLVIQWTDSHLLQPLVVGRAVDLHPLAVVLAVTVGSLLAGIGGAVVAVPLLAAVAAATRFLVSGVTMPPEAQDAS